MIWVALPLLLIGLAFNALAVIGTLRFPDAFTRAHALGLADTLGAFGVLVALAVLHGFSLVSAKFILLVLVLFVINPAVVHAVLQSALDAGVSPWTRKGKR